MKTALGIVSHVSRLALLFVLSASSMAFAAEAGAGTSVSGGTAQQILTRIGEGLATYGLKVVGAIIVFLVGRWVTKRLSSLINKGLTNAKVDPTLVPFIENLAYTALLVFVIIATLAAVGVQTASVIAVLGAAGLAVGLALQGALANFASGVLILTFKPFRVGDFVETAGVKGTVQAIHVFNTVLNSIDNVRIILPNGQVTGSSILNYTANGTRRIDLVVSVAYEDDLRKARRVIESVLAAEPRILPDPAPLVAVSAMAASSIDLVVRPWVKTPDYWDVRFALTEKLKVTLEEHGLTIPFQQHDIHIKADAAALLKNA